MDKQTLRPRLSALRLSLTPEDLKARSEKIVQILASDELVREAENLALYQSFRNEVDVSSLKDIFPKKSIYLPKIDSVQGTMDFLKADPKTQMKAHAWGLSEPEEGERLLKGEATIMIVPALAFDRRGYRLGYGKGFYDRFLSSFPMKTIGVCFSEFLFESLPSEAHDRVVDRVVTEHGSLNVRA